MQTLTLPLDEDILRSLRAGEQYMLSGVLYTARDAAHKRMCDALAAGQPLPIPMQGAVIYFAGPAPAKPGHVIGPDGPTTSGRMDAYSPILMEHGLAGMIGKGRRSADVIEAMVQHGAVYFGATGGCGALIAECIRKAEVVAYEDLGAEAIHRLEVEDFPVIVLIDSQGNDLYQTGPASYLATEATK